MNSKKIMHLKIFRGSFPFFKMRSNKGITLIEMMVAVFILAALYAVVASVGEDLLRTKLKSSTRRLAGMVKYLYNEANTKGISFRMVYDLDEQVYYAETSTEPYYVEMETEELRRTRRAKKEQEEKEELEAEKFLRVESFLTKPVKLPEGIQFVDVYSPHQFEKRTSGKAYTYIFPIGFVEPSVINLKDDNDNIFSVEFMPLTGRSKIRMEYYDAEEKE